MKEPSDARSSGVWVIPIEPASVVVNAEMVRVEVIPLFAREKGAGNSMPLTRTFVGVAGGERSMRILLRLSVSSADSRLIVIKSPSSKSSGIDHAPSAPTNRMGNSITWKSVTIFNPVIGTELLMLLVPVKVNVLLISTSAVMRETRVIALLAVI